MMDLQELGCIEHIDCDQDICLKLHPSGVLEEYPSCYLGAMTGVMEIQVWRDEDFGAR